MCKFTAVVKQVGQQEEVRELVSREWILDVFGEVWLDTLHSKVAYSNQKSIIEVVTGFQAGSRHQVEPWW